MRQSVGGWWRVRGGLQVLLDLWLMLVVCSLSVLGSCMSHCSFLFLLMVVRVILKKEERSRIRAVQMDNLRGVLGIRRMDKGVEEWRSMWTKYVERMENDRIIKKVYVGMCW